MKKQLLVSVAAALTLAACATPPPPPTAAPPPPTAVPPPPTAVPAPTKAPAPAGPVKAEAGKNLPMILLPKFLGIAVFDQANQGAQEAHKELGNTGKLDFLGGTAEKSVESQIEIVTTAATKGAKAVMISNNSGDQLAPAVKKATDAGVKIVTWDSPIPNAEGESMFIAQVDFKETGKVMADMALNILGADGGKFAVLSASPDAANQNAWIASMKDVLKDAKYGKLQLVDTVYGDDQSEKSYKQALALVDKYKDLKLIMAPTTVGIAAAAKAMQDEKLCDKVKISGLGLPAEMVAYTKNGCAPQFALWSFKDLGYLTYYASYMLANGQIKGADGEQFEAGRMGKFTIEKDAARGKGLRVLMGPFSVYDKNNIDKEVGAAPSAPAGAVVEAKKGLATPMILLPKFLGIAVFDQANQGAQEAHKELENGGKLDFIGGTAEKSVESQIEIVTTAATKGAKAVMISNNSGDQLAPAVKKATDAGVKIVTWDSPIPNAEGESMFVAQVDFKETGKVMADMALKIMGADGGKFAVLSASPDAANQNAWIASMKDVLKDPNYAKLQLVDTVYGDDQSEKSYKQALALVDKYKDLKLIMAPTTVGIAAAAKAMTDEKLCDKVKISGLGLPAEMAAYSKSGCAPQFALWSFKDLGYLTYYASYMLANGQIKGADGEQFKAGRMGTFKIEKDAARGKGLRVLMGPFTVYTKDNLDK